MEIFFLKDEDLLKLKKHVRSGAPGHEVIRAMTLILRNNGQTRSDVANVLNITTRTVTNTCSNYANLGLDRSLKDDPRPGQPKVFDERVKSNIVALVCSNPPEGFDRWTLELVKAQAEGSGIVGSISKEKIRIILREHDVKPWQQRMWCVPELTDEYIQRMESILDLYERGDSEDYPLVCLDEKPIVLFEDSRAPVLMEASSSKKVDYEYKRNGTANAFVAVEPFGGKYVVEITPNRKSVLFAQILKKLSIKYKKAKKISLVMDNLNIHTKTSLVREYGETEAHRIWSRFEIYYTPKHGSWLNQAEIAIGMYSRQCLGKTRIPSIKLLTKKTEAWVDYINNKAVTIGWFFTKNEAREKMGYRGKD